MNKAQTKTDKIWSLLMFMMYRLFLKADELYVVEV